MTRNQTIAAAILLTSGLLPATTHAQNIGMPAGSRQWIHLNGNWVQAGTCCDDAVGGVGSIPVPSPNYVQEASRLAIGAAVRANADNQANRMRSCYFMHLTDTVFLYNSMVDTYTISGPPGTEGQPVSARVKFHAAGTMFVGQSTTTSGGLHVGNSGVQLEVGAWNGDPAPAFNEGGRVSPFDATYFASASMPNANYGTSTPTQPFDIVVDKTMSRTVGTPFDLAYCLVTFGYGLGNLSGAATPADGDYAVATIEWLLPPGYTITSTLGWTDPNGPVCDSTDFNGDGLFPDTADIDDFLSVFSGGPCSTGTCGDTDFNNDGLFPDRADIDSLLSVFSGGLCL